jgi:gamma-glutamyl hydrolase
MKAFIFLLSFFAVLSFHFCAQPVIAILSNVVPDKVYNAEQTKVYASYVRWFEAAGASVIVIHPWTPEKDIDDLFTRVNGFFFQGGSRTIDLNAPWETLAKKIVNKIVLLSLQGTHIPLWGTCQGFELIHSIIANTTDVLTNFDAYNIQTPLEFDENTIKSSKMFKFFNDKDLFSLRTQNTTAQFHNLGVSLETYDKYPILKSWFNVTSFGRGLDSKPAIATIEGKYISVYAVQFHPEKIPYDRKPSDQIPQSGNAIKISQNFALFLVEEARKNSNVFPTQDRNRYNIIDTFTMKATLVDGIYYYFFDKKGFIN